MILHFFLKDVGVGSPMLHSKSSPCFWRTWRNIIPKPFCFLAFAWQI